MSSSPLSERHTEHRGKQSQHPVPGDRPHTVWTFSRHQRQGERWQCPGHTACSPAQVSKSSLGQCSGQQLCASTRSPQGLKCPHTLMLKPVWLVVKVSRGREGGV